MSCSLHGADLQIDPGMIACAVTEMREQQPDLRMRVCKGQEWGRADCSDMSINRVNGAELHWGRPRALRLKAKLQKANSIPR